MTNSDTAATARVSGNKEILVVAWRSAWREIPMAAAKDDDDVRRDIALIFYSLHLSHLPIFCPRAWKKNIVNDGNNNFFLAARHLNLKIISAMHTIGGGNDDVYRRRLHYPRRRGGGV